MSRRYAWMALLVALALAMGGRSDAAPPVADGPDTNGFFFVQLSDTHWGARDGLSMTRRAAEMINGLPVSLAFVVVTGDLFQDSIRKEEVRKEALEIMGTVKAPVHYVPGNHDLLKDDRDTTTPLFETHFTRLNRTIAVQGVTCLFFNSELTGDEGRNPADAMRRCLADVAADAPVVVFMHHPPVRDMVNGSDGPVRWDDLYDRRWLDFFSRRSGIKAVFAGHFHRDVMNWIGPVPVYVAPALARFWDRQPAFRLYQYKAGRINFWTYYPERSPSVKASGTKPGGN